MPPTDILLSFAAAAFAVILIPGPTVLLVTGYALAGGWRAAALCIAGVCLGDMVAMALTFLGLGAVLAASASLFTFLKWIGAFYLIYLGVQLWRAPVAAAAPETLEARADKLADQQTLALHRIVSRAFMVNLLHPKGLAFYAAFLPQFIDPSRPALAQMIALGAVFTLVAMLVLSGYAFTATRLRPPQRPPRLQPHRRKLPRGCRNLYGDAPARGVSSGAELGSRQQPAPRTAGEFAEAEVLVKRCGSWCFGVHDQGGYRQGGAGGSDAFAGVGQKNGAQPLPAKLAMHGKMAKQGHVYGIARHFFVPGFGQACCGDAGGAECVKADDRFGLCDR